MSHKEIQAQIKVLKTELGKLEELAKEPKKFEFKFRKGETYLLDNRLDFIEKGCTGSLPERIRIGVYRTTKEGAELSLERNRKANRLEMLAEYLGGLKEFVYDENNWYVFSSNESWNVSISSSCYSPERVYMTEEVAMKIADMLNNGEYEL